MVHRIFDSSEIQCTCVLKQGESEVLRAPVDRISREGAQLDTYVVLEQGTVFAATVHFADGRTSKIIARVADSGSKRLSLTWDIEDPWEEDDFEMRLLEGAESFRATSAVSAPMDGSPIVRIDGEVDVEATLRSRARMVDTSRLAKRRQSVRLLDLTTITHLIKEAVDSVVESSQGEISQRERERLLEETERKFAERLAEYETEKKDLAARAENLDSQLTNARRLLEEEQQRVIEAQSFTVSDAGIVELETRLGRMLDRSIDSGCIDKATQEEMRAVLSKLLDDERERLAEKAREAQSERIDLLERKIGRLSRSLDQTTGERDRARRHAHELETRGGIAMGNIMEPGIDFDDPLRLEKLAILNELVEENHELRKHMTAAVPTGVGQSAGSDV